MKIDLKRVEQEIEKGNIIFNQGTDGWNDELAILNYTRVCQFSNDWNDITLLSRGLVINVYTGEIIARPFKKFFNWQEHNQEHLPNIPMNTPFTAYEKLDGSLGICFHYAGKWRMITRGSWNSDQAIKGQEILDSKNWVMYDILTYLFEIIYPQDRKVVDYGAKEELILLGAFDLEEGEALIESPAFDGIPKAKSYNFSSIKDAINFPEQKNREGFVLAFDDIKDEDGFELAPNSERARVKVKFDEYVRLHKIVTDIHKRNIWEILKDNDAESFEEILQTLPDEYYDKIRDVQTELITQFNAIETEVKQLFDHSPKTKSRKEFAEWAKSTKYPGLMFSLMDGRNIESAIWNMIKPEAEKIY